MRGWAGTYTGSFFMTTDGGMTWDSLYTVPSSGDDFTVQDLSFPDSLYGWAFGLGFYQGRITEAIYHTTDGGYSWYRESIGLTDDLGDIPDGVMIDRTHGWAVASDGRVLAYRLVTAVVERLPDVPEGFALRQNYPNPFNPVTTIEYELPQRTWVRMLVLDAVGQTVRTLVEGSQEIGVYRVTFDGSGLASGAYWCTLTTGDHKATRQMILLR
jgi:hypothetical protein